MGEHRHTFPERHHGARRTVGAALAITVVMGAVELAGGLLSNSLALQGDAAHMFMDAAALAIAFASLSYLTRSPRGRQTFGWHRVEVLGALLNGLLLVAISGYVLWRAYGRLLHPEEVQGPLMLAVAVVGLAVNGVALALLHRHESASLGARGAFLHILSDTITSVATIVAGVLVWQYGIVLADPLIALLIVAFILRGAAGLVRDSAEVLLEAAPAKVDRAGLEAFLRGQPGVRGVHDVHVWSLTAGVTALSAHVEVPDMPLRDAVALKEALKAGLHERGVEHVVLELDLQVSLEVHPPETEPDPFRDHLRQGPGPGHGHGHRH